MRTTIILMVLGCAAICLACGVIGSQPAIAESPMASVGDAPAAALPVGAECTGEPAADPTTQALIASLTIFVLAMLLGFEVITKVPPTLHTPLMSGSNAISGITLVGALVSSGADQTGLATWLGTIAVAMATINVVGGFLVTHRMLEMFRKK